MDRRQFIGGMVAAGGLALTDPGYVLNAAGRDSKTSRGAKNEDKVVLVSDFHTNPEGYQSDRLRLVVADILKMRPLPRAVVAFGDIAYLTGREDEYRNAREILSPLKEAGIELVMGMGNHDRRDNFSIVFPEYASSSLLPDRLVSILKGPYADIIMLDSLQQGDDRSAWITEGAIDSAQREWLAGTLASYTKPVFVAAHHPLEEIRIDDLLLGCPYCAGFLYGHHHIWRRNWIHVNYSSKRIVPTICLPSTGHWGDIGYVVFRMKPDRTEAELVQTDFYFPKEVPASERLPQWDCMVENNRGAHSTFLYPEI